MPKKHLYPEVSSFTFFKNAKRILKNPLPFHRENFEALGDTFRLNLGFSKSVVFSRDPDLAIYALRDNQKNFRKSEIQTKDLAKYVGKGLLTSEGENWKMQRKLMQPAFHKKNIYTLLNFMLEAIDKEIARIEINKTTDVFPIFNDLAFKVVAKSLFSDAINSDEIAKLQEITEENQKMLVKELRQPYKHWWFLLNGSLAKNLRLSQQARDILDSIIKRRHISGAGEKDLLDMLMGLSYEDGTKMNHEKLIDEILILFIAGHETTANSLSFTIQLLAQNQKVQKKLADEVVLLSKNESSPFDILMSSPYTGYVIQESMRLFPPVYFIDRENISVDTFKQKEMPEGTNFLFSIYEIHRNQKNWLYPNDFIPERFENLENVSSFYFPFGAGPRKCIGSNFAMYEITLALHQLLKKFRIESIKPDIEIEPLISLKPKNALVRFVKR